MPLREISRYLKNYPWSFSTTSNLTSTHLTTKNENCSNPRTTTPKKNTLIAPFWISIILKIKITCQLIWPLRTRTAPIREPRRPRKKALFSLALVAGDMICFVVKSENLMKRGLWSRLGCTMQHEWMELITFSPALHTHISSVSLRADRVLTCICKRP